MKRFVANALLGLTSVLLFLILCEGLLWLVNPPPRPGLPSGMFALGSRGEWIMTPDWHGTMDNRVDFRDKAAHADSQGRRVVPAAPEQADRHLYVIGDSQSFGHGLSDQESWPNRLQEAFNKRNLSIKVVNLAIPAINIDQYRLKMQILAPHVRPGDQVVVGVSWNDLTTPQDMAPVMRIIEGQLVTAKPGELSEQAAEARVKVFQATGVVIPQFNDLKMMLEGLSNISALVHTLYPRAKAVYYRWRSDRPLQALIADNVPESNFWLLADGIAALRSAGAETTVMLLPDRIFFEDEAWRIYSVNGRDLPVQNYMGHVAQPLCQKFTLTCLDSFGLLHANQNLPVAYRTDGHYNPDGARLLGEWLADRLD